MSALGLLPEGEENGMIQLLRGRPIYKRLEHCSSAATTLQAIPHVEHPIPQNRPRA